MPPHSFEALDKELEDCYPRKMPVWIDGAIIVGAGPSGMAAAACLKEKGVPSMILEKADCIGSLWKHRTYDRVHLHIPKQFCELPHMPFPDWYPTYPSRQQFLDYLEDYAQRFSIKPLFNEGVHSARYDGSCGVWRVNTLAFRKATSRGVEMNYTARWLIVASGENAEIVTPTLPGMKGYEGHLIHSSLYKNGEDYEGRKVLVVGCGNSGMEIALDLANHKAKPSLVVRGPVHVLPREIFGRSTFAIAIKLMKTFPVWLTDRLLVFYTWLILGNVANCGFRRPKEGPMELKDKVGKTPVLDVGTVDKIRSGHIKVVPCVESLTSHGVRFENGITDSYDAVILATGYRSNVPRWLQGEDQFFSENGYPRTSFPHGWKVERGLYTVGLCRKGLLGASFDAQRISEDIERLYRSENTRLRIRYRLGSPYSL